jgi:hypothetical protein
MHNSECWRILITTNETKNDDKTMLEEGVEGRIKSVHSATRGSNAERAARVYCSTAIPIHGIHRTVLSLGRRLVLCRDERNSFFPSSWSTIILRRNHAHTPRDNKETTKAKQKKKRPGSRKVVVCCLARPHDIQQPRSLVSGQGGKKNDVHLTTN